MNGLGAEIAKNVVLANVKAVTLHDNAVITSMDLSSHFYATRPEVKFSVTVCGLCLTQFLSQ